MASYAEQQAERQRIKAMQEKQRAKSAAAHQQRVDANAEAKRRQQQQTNQIRAQEAQQAQQQQRLRAQRESERRKNAAARQIEIEQARAKEKSMRIDPALPDPAYDIPSDTSYSARLKAHEKKVERARQEDARRARLGLEPRMYIPEFWNPPPKPGSIEALPIPLVPIVPREGQIRAKTVAPQQSRAAVVADETSASIGQGQQQTPTKPPPTAEDLEIARDKAQIQAREAQQKLDNPNVATPRNREYQDIEKQQRDTLEQPQLSAEPTNQRRLQGKSLEQQQQGTLGQRALPAPTPPTEPTRVNLVPVDHPRPLTEMERRVRGRIIEQQQLGTLGQTSQATMQSLQPDPRAKAVGSRVETSGAQIRLQGGRVVNSHISGQGKYGNYGYINLSQLYNQTGRISWDEFHALDMSSQQGYLHRLESQVRPHEFQRMLDEFRGPKPREETGPTGFPLTPREVVDRQRVETTDIIRRAQEAVQQYSAEELQHASISGQYAVQNLGITPQIAIEALRIMREQRQDQIRGAAGANLGNLYDSALYRGHGDF